MLSNVQREGPAPSSENLKGLGKSLLYDGDVGLIYSYTVDFETPISTATSFTFTAYGRISKLVIQNTQIQNNPILTRRGLTRDKHQKQKANVRDECCNGVGT